jgi:hypothetical protein
VLPLQASQVADLIEGGDTRWVHRGGHDLLDAAPEATTSGSGMPRGRSLYGSLPAQVDDPASFVSGLRGVLEVRERFDVAVGSQVDVPDVGHPGMLVMVHRLDNGDPTGDARLQLTVLNFTGESILATVRSEQLPARRIVRDATTGEEVGTVDDLSSFPVQLEPYAGLFLLLDEEPEAVEDDEEDAAV